jgi:hypothetical protein
MIGSQRKRSGQAQRVLRIMGQTFGQWIGTQAEDVTLCLLIGNMNHDMCICGTLRFDVYTKCSGTVL